jgi:hypothetical protein
MLPGWGMGGGWMHTLVLSLWVEETIILVAPGDLHCFLPYSPVPGTEHALN